MPKNLIHSSSLDASASKSKRGRPRKTVAPEALAPYEDEVPATEPFERQEQQLSAAKTKDRRTNPATSDRSYTPDEVEFMNALDEFKRASGRTFPTCSDVLGVLRKLGYEKVT